jgi:3-oxoacyl-[acyl-carrier protein] reductase
MAANKTESLSQPNPDTQSVSSHSLSGKVALVTGGSRGIGYAIARVLAGEGCDVVITARDTAALSKSAAQIVGDVHGGVSVVPITCDVRSPESIDALFRAVRERFGRIDVLVNNAGVSQPSTPLEQTSLELWRAIIETNLTGVFLCTRAALPLMQAGATIVNNLSAAAKQLFPQYYAYTSAKMGALGFTLSLRDELSPRGIRVMALLPGATNTDIWQQIMPNAPREHMIDVDSVAQAVLYAVLLPPNVNPTEISLDPVGGAL